MDLHRALVLVLVLFFSVFANAAADREWFSEKKSDEKKAVHWSLQEWLQQKSRNSMMDMWLMMHTPTPYEYYLSLDDWNYEPQPTKTNDSVYDGALTAYATVVGLSVEYSHNTREGFSDLTGLFVLRLFGNAYQGTHLVFGLGQRTRSFEPTAHTDSLINPVALVDLNIYLNKQFGLSAEYRNLGAVTHTALGTISETLGSAGLFIDFSSLRIEGVYKESQEKTSTGISSSTLVRRGTQARLSWFF